MNPTNRKWISRKELAIVTDLTVDIIRRNESKLGLDQVRVTVNQRTILYHREPALAKVEHLIEYCSGTH